MLDLEDKRIDRSGTTPCRGCGLKPGNRARGLCYGCYTNPERRTANPLETDRQRWSRVDEGATLNRPLAPLDGPLGPTRELPGTAAKIEVMRQRVAAGYRPTHPLDRTLEDCVGRPWGVGWEESP